MEMYVMPISILNIFELFGWWCLNSVARSILLQGVKQAQVTVCIYLVKVLVTLFLACLGSYCGYSTQLSGCAFGNVLFSRWCLRPGERLALVHSILSSWCLNPAARSILRQRVQRAQVTLLIWNWWQVRPMGRRMVRQEEWGWTWLGYNMLVCCTFSCSNNLKLLLLDEKDNSCML